MSYIESIVLLCLCAGGTLFFSVVTIALRTYSRAKLAECFRVRKKEALTEKLVERSENLVLTCALYRIIFNMCILLILLNVFAILRSDTPQMLDYVIASLVAVVIFMTFSLAIPHALAKYSGERFLCRSYSVICFFALTAQPILHVFRLYDSFIKRLLGVAEVTPEEEAEEKQEEFLSGLVQHRMEGVVDEEEQEMIENVLELSDTAADEIITPRTDIVAIEVNSDLNEVLEVINSAGHSRFPIYEDNVDNIIGLIYAKDLLSEIGKDPANFRLRDKLREAYFVPETKPLRELLHDFQNQKQHIAIVLDEYGGVAGIVTLEDILEELVGEITDEYEETPTEHIRRIDENTIEVDARTYIDDLNDEFEFNLPEEEDYDTIGGFVFSHLGYIPKTSETFEYMNLKFTVSAAEARKIKRLIIQKTSDVKENAE